ncbi:MAG TPA: alpha/beta fold hydrolase [Pyrinomonadaceae bacterium]|nr:alpha/beta fold hydrolase [Pyrinomonadaceae bacterium]
MKRSICVICGLLLFASVACAQEQRFANIGDLKLQNGGVIRNCRVGYRTFGTLNNDKSNVIVFPTWAGGTTEQLKSNFGRGKLIDTTSYFVVAIDALSNGVSSSPSNSRLQPRMRFPMFSLRDTVESQHELLTKVLNLDHVKAVVGISMGGMQTFQWIVSYPDFMDKAVPIVGSPRLAPYDLMLWAAQIEALMRDRDWKGGNYVANPARALDFAFGELLLTTPTDYNRRKTREQVFADLEKARKDTKRFDANDKIRQTQAMMQLDVSSNYGVVKAKVLVVVAKFDHVVTPGPAREFARLIGAKIIDLEGDCGHLATSCESPRLNEAVSRFLNTDDTDH